VSRAARLSGRALRICWYDSQLIPFSATRFSPCFASTVTAEFEGCISGGKTVKPLGADKDLGFDPCSISFYPTGEYFAMAGSDK
jgi:hypothetical protein